MIVGVPKEIKQDEYRVAMLPVGVEELTRRGHKVLIEAGAGTGSGLPDSDYVQAGAELIEGPAEIFARYGLDELTFFYSMLASFNRHLD